MASYLESLTALEAKMAAVEQAIDDKDRAATAQADQLTQRLDTLLDGITSTTPGQGSNQGSVESTTNASSVPSWTTQTNQGAIL